MSNKTNDGRKYEILDVNLLLDCDDELSRFPSTIICTWDVFRGSHVAVFNLVAVSNFPLLPSAMVISGFTAKTSFHFSGA
jgi:hypothetical protein